MWKKILMLLPVLPVLFITGCTTSNPDTIARLSPSEQPRNPNNQYLVRTAFKSDQQSLLMDTVKASIVVDGKIIPMSPMSKVKNRWEGYLPVPAGQSSVTYRFLFDFQYDSFGKGPKPDTKYSPPYTLKIVD